MIIIIIITATYDFLNNEVPESHLRAFSLQSP